LVPLGRRLGDEFELRLLFEFAARAFRNFFMLLSASAAGMVDSESRSGRYDLSAFRAG
jgi:hypothetical protein